MQFLTFINDSIGFVSDSRASFFVLSPVGFFPIKSTKYFLYCAQISELWC